MKITPREVSVRALVEDYVDNQEGGVVGLGGWLNIRPAYQREFVYKDDQRAAVIDTVRKGFPLNVMYWVVDSDDPNKLEVLDGQQRTISICEYCTDKFPIKEKGNNRYFHNLSKEEQDVILNYKLMVYFCEGTDKEKLDWFETINIAGEKLTKQELRNAVYTGLWLSDAKAKFSKTGCPAYKIGDKYVSGTPNRQEYLETVLNWINNGDVTGYMAEHQQDANATDLWVYYNNVMSWVKLIFPTYRKEMKGLPWGVFYNEYKDKELNPVELEASIKQLMEDDEVTKKKGIYAYVLSGTEKHLSIRTFTEKQKRQRYEQQGQCCAHCGEHTDIKLMDADHIVEWSKGGKTDMDNLQMLCKACHNNKTIKLYK